MRILSLKSRIMAGAYALYAVRKLKTPFVPETLVFILLGGIISASVSVPAVIANMSHASNALRYFIIAFSNTRIAIQSMVMLVIATVIFSLRNFGNILELSRSSSVGRAPLS